jgi:pyruvate,orthophosphate dikinase
MTAEGRAPVGLHRIAGGREAESFAWEGSTGLDYVSCSPYRVPIARLAAAHAALEDSTERDK